MHLELTDSRRLTGPNLFWDRASAIIDVSIDGSPDAVIQAWEAAAKLWLDRVGYSEEKTCFRIYEGGASLLISAPIDVLYSMCELNELAWAGALAACAGGEAPDPDEEVPRLNRLFDEERNPALLALQAAARQRGVPFLWDDDEVSLGYGKTCRRWSPDALPAPDELDWRSFGTVPVALVTGTNGKSTTVRLAAAIMKAAGFNAGLTSTDFIRVGDRLIDQGDYSGTGGARTLMRQPDLEMAVLEVARGGLLRRGLGVERADAAVVTNVAADHLGEYGINSVEDLIPAKFIVRRALGKGAPLILNADDEGVVSFARKLGNRIVWFSLDPANTLLTESLAKGETAAWLEGDALVLAEGTARRQVVRVAEIPATMSGIVRYNIRNALAAMCIAAALGINDDAIRKGLASFQGDEHDNPGRGNWFEREKDGGAVRILVDFAHNQHGMEALAETISRVPSERVILLIGQAGDRLDKDIADLVRAACRVCPQRLLVAELPGYERGRKPFEVPELIRAEALRNGIPGEAIEVFSSPRDATAEALRRAQTGDLLVLLALTQRAETLELIHDYVGSGESRRG